MKFTLEIKLGNEAMQTGENVAEALAEVQRRLENGHESGFVFDYNGNRVGEWGVQ